MKIRTFFSLFFTAVAIWAAGAAVWLCGAARNVQPVLMSSPEPAQASVTALMDAICDSDYQTAAEQLSVGSSLGADRAPADAIGVLLWDAWQQSLSYDLTGACIATNDGLVQQVRLTCLDLDAVAAPLREYARKILAQRVADAEDLSEVYDAENNYREDVVMDVLYEAAELALEQNSTMETVNLTLPLRWDEDRWRVVADWDMMDQFDMFIINQTSIALDGVLAVKKTYWLSDSDLIAPEPNPACYGQAESPAELDWLLEEAQELLDGQQMIFSVDTPAWEGSPVYYYFDETILVITWKQVIDRSIYTLSEVKIAHGSQFRRFLADGEYGSDKQYVTTDMAAGVNAVVASSGDFYKFRRNGIVVYEGEVKRVEGHHVDTCFINEDGDLLFAYRDDILDRDAAEAFVAENNVRYSLTFGPILVDDGVVVSPRAYTLGEIDGWYSRAAICQVDSRHYLLANLTEEGGYSERQTAAGFAAHLQALGVEKAYALDGGQTAVIAMDGQAITRPDYGTQRAISDIIYFATALPDGGA